MQDAAGRSGRYLEDALRDESQRLAESPDLRHFVCIRNCNRGLKTEIPDQTTAPPVESPGSIAVPDSLAPLAQPFSKESAILIALAVAGNALKIPLVIGFKPIFHSAFGHPLIAFGLQIALVCIVPFAVRMNRELGLPGAPFLRARLARRPPPGRLRSLIRIALLYDLASIALSIVALAGLVFSGALPLSVASHGASHASPFEALRGQAGRVAMFGALAAIGAGLSEEVMFRLSLFAIFLWLFRVLLQDRTDRPSRAALWCATIMQGYVFGLAHIIFRPKALPKMRMPTLITGLAVPQTWAGIVLGRLYLKHGLEASMIAHAMMDLGLFLLAAVLLYLIELHSGTHSGLWTRALTAGYG